MEEFTELMPVTPVLKKQLEQCTKMFSVVKLAGLPSALDSVQDQILASPAVPSMDDLLTRLLQLVASPMSSNHPGVFCSSISNYISDRKLTWRQLWETSSKVWLL